MVMSVSVLCVEITKPEPTMTQCHGRVYLRTVKKDANFKTNFKIYNLTLTHTLPLATKTSAR